MGAADVADALDPFICVALRACDGKISNHSWPAPLKPDFAVLLCDLFCHPKRPLRNRAAVHAAPSGNVPNVPMGRISGVPDDLLILPEDG